MLGLVMVLLTVSTQISGGTELDQIVTKKISSYPFIATKERIANIQTHYQLVKVGMSPVDVKKTLGEPDEITPSLEPSLSVITNDKVVGYNYWYVIQRLVQYGSFNEQSNIYVLVVFNLNDQVMRVRKEGFE
jgi:hypothetical protein